MIRIIGLSGLVGLFVGVLVPACGGSDGTGAATGSSGGINGNGGASANGGSTSSGGSNGGGGTTGSSGFSTGLPPSESLGSLAAADKTTVCQALAAYSASILPDPKALSCKLAAIGVAAVQNATGAATTDAAVQKACADFVSGCAQSSLQDAGSSCQFPSTPCTGTIAELETCVTDETKATKDAVSKVPDCANLTVQDLQPSDGGGLFGTSTARPPSCVSLETKCPGWSFGGSQQP